MIYEAKNRACANLAVRLGTQSLPVGKGPGTEVSLQYLLDTNIFVVFFLLLLFHPYLL